MATHSSILAWRIPWTEEPGRLQSMSSRWSHMSHTHTHTHMHIANKLFALEDLSQNLLIGKPNLRQLGLLRKEEVHVGCDEPARKQLLQKCSEV